MSQIIDSSFPIVLYVFCNDVVELDRYPQMLPTSGLPMVAEEAMQVTIKKQ
jgi:hypothetical protein